MEKPLTLLFDVDDTLISKKSDTKSMKEKAFEYSFKRIFHISNVSYRRHPIHGLTDQGILRLIQRHFNFISDDSDEREKQFWG